MKIRLPYAITAVFGLSLAAIYGVVFRLYTYVKFIPVEKWFSSPYMVAVTLSVFGGLIGAIGLTVLASLFLKDLHRIENISSDVKVNKELEHRLEDLAEELADTKEELARTKEKARIEIESLAQKKEEGEQYIRELFGKKLHDEKEAKAKAEDMNKCLGAMGGEKKEAPTSSVVPQSSAATSTNIEVRQNSGCAGCGWAIFAILVLLIIGSAIWWAQVIAFFNF